MHRIWGIGLGWMVALACGGCRCGDPPPAPAPAAPNTAPAPARIADFAFPLEPATPTALRAVPAFEALRFDRPLWLTHAPGDPEHIYVAEQGGRVHRVANRPDVEQTTVVLDLGDRVRLRHNEEGLLGLAFDPGYADNGLVYVVYSASNPRRTLLSRFSTTAEGHIDPASEREILGVEQPYGNHNGGMIAFGPDGYLYFGLGDGGAGGDPHGNGQDTSTLLGTIVRIEVGPSLPSYAVPVDNPLVDVPGARPEIWAYGLRNPWRFSFDRQTGTLWCGDVGQDAIEEIDIIVAGGNYGWNLREGTRVFGPSRTAVGLRDPVAEYGHDQGQSVTGGYVYRGSRLADLRGAYIYGDFVTGHVWALQVDGDTVRSHARVANVQGLASFGEDADGELYAVSFDGKIYRWEARDAAVASRRFPTALSDTGLFTDTAALTPSPALLPYGVTVPFWSDGANKQRWVYVPPDEIVQTDPHGPWTFPVGTITVKHFAWPGQPGRRLETRVMIHQRDGWAGYTYRWNDAQTDASLVTTPATGAHPQADGSTRRWSYPAGADCLRCHTPGYGQALGLRTRQLAGTDPGRALIATLTERGQLEPVPGPTPSAHPRLLDDAAPVADRARAYLDVNCAPCHHPGGPAPGGLDLRVDTALAEAAALDVAPDAEATVAGERRLVAGDPQRSSLWIKPGLRGRRGQMPPLASLRVDEPGRALLGRWIESLAP